MTQAGLTPQLVVDKETGKLCMQIRMGVYTATAEIPEDIKSWPALERESFFEKMVPEMVTELHEMRRIDQRKFRRKLGDSGS